MTSAALREWCSARSDRLDEAMGVFVQQAAGAETALAPVVRELPARVARFAGIERSIPDPDVALPRAEYMRRILQGP